MKVRYQEYDGKWLYDTKKKVLYDIVDKDCYRSKIDMIQLTKFHPFARLTKTYVVSPYRMRN